MKKFITRTVIGLMAIALPAFAGGGYNDGNLPVGSNISGHLIVAQGAAVGTPASITLTNGIGLPLAGLNSNTANTLLGFNNSGAAADVTLGTGVLLSGGILSATGTGGTVTTASVTSANGFAGSVANATTTPAITISTTVTGLLKGNGTAISTATSGTDYAPATTGTSILKASSGGFANAAAGTDYIAPGGALGTPSSGTATNLIGTASGLTAGAVSTINGLITAGSNVTITGAGTSGSPYSIASSGSGGSSAFSALTSSTNTTAAMVVGTGASLGVSGSGTITATAVPASGITGATLASGVTGSSLMGVGALASGSLTTGFTTVAAAQGGTGQTSVASAFTSFFESVATTLGDIVYGGASGAPTRLVGNTSATTALLTSTGNGTVAAAPAWTLPASMTPAFNGSAITALNGSNISSGTIAAARLPAATTSTLGVVSTDGATLTNTAGAIACATGTTSQLGCVRPDGTIITNTAGAITVAKATSSLFGVIEGDGATLGLSAGVLSLNVGNANTWTAGQTFTDGDLLLKGSSSGAMVLHAPAVAGSFGITFPAATDTVDVLGTAQNITAAKTFSNNDILLLGSSTGATIFISDNSSSSNFNLHIPAVNDTITTNAATQNLTNKTYDTASNTFKINGTGITSISGNTSTVATTTGTLTSTHCVNIDSSGNLKDSGIACGSGGSGLTVGSTSITSGTNTYVEFNNSGTLGEYAISGSGTVAMTTSPSFTTPALGTPSAVVLTNASGTASSLTAGNASNIGTTSTSSNAVFYPLFVGSISNSNQASQLNSALNFNASTGTLSSTILSGILANGTTATTQSANDNSTKVSTTAYVKTAVSFTQSSFNSSDLGGL